MIRSRERLVFGYIAWNFSPGSFDEEPGMAPGDYLWPFDAEMRGYDMALFNRPWLHRGAVIAT